MTSTAPPDLDPRSAALWRVRAEHAQGTEAPIKAPRTLPLADITTETGVFQMRTREGSLQGSDRWIGKLRQKLQQTDGQLDPILVWWTGARWVVLDGHHRLEAYRAWFGGRKGTAKVSVKACQAETVEDALVEANCENAKDKLNTTDEDKWGQAWFLIVQEVDLSLRKIEQATGTSKSTAQRMMKVRDTLKGRGWGCEGMTHAGWQKAREAAEQDEGGQYPDWTEEEQMRQEAKRWAVRLRAEFGDKLFEAPDIAALMNRPGFTGGQNSRRITRYGICTEEDLEAVFA